MAKIWQKNEEKSCSICLQFNPLLHECSNIFFHFSPQTSHQNVTSSSRMGTRKLGFGYPQYHGEIELSTFAVALHFEKSSNMAKNDEKPCSTCLKPISSLYSRYSKIRFRVPVLPLVTRTCVILISATESHRSHIKKEKFSRRFLLTRETLIPALNFTTTSF